MGKMKANRKFIDGEEAVSAVIGVILMVAITVAIAATVYVYVSGMIGSPTESAPDVTFQVNEGDDRLVVITTDPDVTWDEFAVRCDTDTVIFLVDSELVLVGGLGQDAILDTIAPITDTTSLDASDFIDFEAGNFVAAPGPHTVVGAELNDVKITIIHEDTDTVIGTFTFSSIAIIAA